ncbi:MAG: hypothetical protein RLY13_462 [Actinomycetota bacterium]|jgi:hypothetical protein
MPSVALGPEEEPNNEIKRNVRNNFDAEEYFGQQWDSTKDLPDPEPSLKALATGVIEVIAGTRQLDQLSRLLSEDVYQRLGKRAHAARMARASKGTKARHQNFSVQKLHCESPRDGVIESVVIVNSPRRARAVTIRLEGINHRWRATAVSVL